MSFGWSFCGAWERAVESHPRSAVALYYLGLVQWAEGDKERGMGLSHRARRLDRSISIPH